MRKTLKKTTNQTILKLTANAAETESRILVPMTGGRVRLLAKATGDVRRYQLLAYTGGFAHIPDMPFPVVFELSTLTAVASDALPLLLNHQVTQDVGHVADLAIGETQITAIGITSTPGEYRDRVNGAVDAGKTWQLSVGVYAAAGDIELIGDGETRVINRQTLQGPFLLARNGDLREISFTGAGADASGAIAKLAASLGAKKMNFEQYVQSLGLNLADLTANAIAALRRSWGEQHPQQAADEAAATTDVEDVADGTEADDTATGTLDDDQQLTPAAAADSNTETQTQANAPTVPADDQAGYRERSAREVERTEALTQMNAQFQPGPITVNGRSVSLLAHGIRNNWDANRFELECRRRQRPSAPGVVRQSGGNRDMILASLCGAAMQRLNVPVDGDFLNARPTRVVLNAMAEPGRVQGGAALCRDVNDTVRQQWMDRSDRFRNHSMVDLMIEAAALDGIDLRAAGVRSGYRGDAFIQAAFSSTAIQDVFTQSLSARLMSRYLAEESDLMRMVVEREIPNFLSQERKRIEAGGAKLRKLINQGVAKDMTLSATGESYTASMYATRFQFSEEDMLSERWDTLEEAGDEMGEASRHLVYDLVALMLMNNPTMSNTRAFFNTTDGNYATSTALTRANLEAQLIAFGTQTENGRNINMNASQLLVAKANAFNARELLAPTNLIIAGGTDSTRTAENTLAGEIDEVLREVRLDNGFEDPTSTAAVPATIAALSGSWFLADRRYPSMEVGFVQGHGRAPRIRRGNLSNGQYGMWIDCSMAVGAAPLRRAPIRRCDA
jgi:hypothetical protein